MDKKKLNNLIKEAVAKDPYIDDVSLANSLGVSYDTVLGRRRRMGIPYQKKPKEERDVLKEVGLTPVQLRRLLQGQHRKPKILKHVITDKTFTFAVVSDTHFGSNQERVDELHTFYDVCRKEKITTVLHCGDILNGWGIYRGMENDTHTFGAHAQAQYVIKNYPKVDGLETWFITGNHCLSWYDRSGVDVGDIIASERPDMKYLGQYNAEIHLGDVRVRMVHPKKAGAYAISYHAQKFVEQIQSGRKPHIIFFGHAHTALYFFYRNVHVFHAGCFQDQTNLELRLGLNPAIGGWIIKLHLGDKKTPVVGMTPTFIPFFAKGDK